MGPQDWLAIVAEIQAITQSGLHFANNPFDKERYIRLRDIAAQFALPITNHSLQELKSAFAFDSGYATPKIDVRSFIVAQ